MLREATQGLVMSRAGGWQDGTALGWAAMLVPEAHDGAREAGGIVGAAIVAEELARALQPSPLVAISVVADAIALFGTDAQQRSILPPLAAGELTATWAIAEGDRTWDGTDLMTELVTRDGALVLRGLKSCVPDANTADQLLVTAKGLGGLTQVLVPTTSNGVSIEPLESLDLGRDLAAVRFDDVTLSASTIVGTPGAAAAAVERQLHLAAALTAVDSVGATQQLFDHTLAYAKDRIAFGRPIGSFQAVKHLLADAATWLEAAHAAVWHAVDALDAGDADASEAVTIAKAFTGEHCGRIAQDCMQVHGGIAMTWEHDAHRYLRRIRTNDALYGGPAWHRDRLCTLIGMGAR